MQNQWALITGASSGIGFEYAKVLGERKYNLVIVSNEQQAIQEKGQWLKEEYKIEVFPVYLDLALPEAARQLYAYCQEKSLEVEVLINNAGMFYFGEVLDQKSAQVEKMVLLHLLTPTMLCRLFGADMKKRGRGYILNMSSMSAWLPYPGIALYASTKRYLKSFSRAFRSELYGSGVSVTTLCPGGVATNLYHLSERMQKLAIRLGFMMRPGKLARKGIRAMFRERAMRMPGFLNHLFLPLLLLLPAGFVRWTMRKSGLLPKTNQK
ncbi:SDR family NAD(P)-dependent oxidoreductase [Odoribacter laneus]|uniref:SDR family NAD(P)-dependent oxidoreductase n=1 Tax=Odoribacter laneus TaxID=626933 RepID=UPI001DB92A9E|nr:SDR family NAD(P)-dependent oxidoreductase [Odoribacter laneus]MBS1446322.1 SDR family NAD(P)-dependent oxidoreductase [Odoribacter sp.]